MEKNMNLISVSGRIGSGKDTVGEIIQYLSSRLYKEDKISYKEYKVKLEGRPNHNNTFKIKKYADKLKDMVCLMIGCTREQLEDREFKEKELGPEWWCAKIRDSKTNKTWLITAITHEEIQDYLAICTNYTVSDGVVKLTPRKLMQLLGTECGREILHPNLWCISLFSEYKPLPKQKSGHVSDADFNSYRGTCEKCQENFNSKNKRQRLCLKHWEEEVNYPKWIITDTRFLNELEAIKSRGGITIRVNRWIDEELTEDQATDLYIKSVEVYGIDDNGIESLIEEAEQFNNFSRFATARADTELHESETALDNAEFDYEIDNNGSIEDLIDIVKEILKKEEML